jgi:hypothetical protein
LITEGGGVLGRAERVEEAAVGGDRGGDLEDEGAGVVGTPRLPAAPGRPERPCLQIREAHRRTPSTPWSTAAARRRVVVEQAGQQTRASVAVVSTGHAGRELSIPSNRSVATDGEVR